jgi:hypothetical protein
MKTKIFRIGEYAVGGIIESTVNKDSITICARDWNTNKIISQKTFEVRSYDLFMKIDEYLNELTSSYYAEKVLKWIKSES